VPPRDGPPGPEALAALPLVGAVLGAAAGAAGAGAARILPAPLPAAVALCSLALLTGAIHLDGFLDGCDAFVASVPVARRLEILKDPRHGTFAVTGMFAAGSLALAAVAAIPPRRYPAVFAFAATLARAAAVTGAFIFPGARSDTGGPHYTRQAEAVLTVATALAALAVAAPPYRWESPLLVPLALGTALGIERWICGRIGGLTGDAYGFTIVVVETEILVALAAYGRQP